MRAAHRHHRPDPAGSRAETASELRGVIARLDKQNSSIQHLQEDSIKHSVELAERRLACPPAGAHPARAYRPQQRRPAARPDECRRGMDHYRQGHQRRQLPLAEPVVGRLLRRQRGSLRGRAARQRLPESLEALNSPISPPRRQQRWRRGLFPASEEEVSLHCATPATRTATAARAPEWHSDLLRQARLR